MESIVMLALPVVVTVLTQLVKSLQSIKFSQNKKAFVRITALTISFFGAVILNALAGEEVPVAQIETYAEALLAFVATQVPYWYGKMNSRGTI